VSDLMKTEFSRQIVEKHSKTKFHENPSSGSRGIHKTEMTKLIVAFRNFVKAANKQKKNIHNITLSGFISQTVFTARYN
jgi:hypothetical protein